LYLKNEELIQQYEVVIEWLKAEGDAESGTGSGE
jgi:hypothetical protein